MTHLNENDLVVCVCLHDMMIFGGSGGWFFFIIIIFNFNIPLHSTKCKLLKCILVKLRLKPLILVYVTDYEPGIAG